MLAGDYSASSDLSSAAVSALAFSRWLEMEYVNPEAPLGTVELVLTPAINSAAPPGVERATLANIQNAFDIWFQEATSSPSNVSIFYFAGHGVWYDESFLLAEDFNPSHPTRPWGAGAFSMDATHSGLKRCNASYQLSFVEACQTLPLDLLGAPTIDVRGLIDRSTQTSSREAPLLFASRPGEPAHGAPGDVANFTRALLHVLRGAGADPLGDEWEINTADLTKIGDVLRFWASLQLIPDQDPHFVLSGGRRLALFSTAPEVEALVRIAPSSLVSSCSLHFEELFTNQVVDAPPGNGAPHWQVKLPKGSYRVTALEQALLRGGPKRAPLYDVCPVVVL